MQLLASQHGRKMLKPLATSKGSGLQHPPQFMIQPMRGERRWYDHEVIRAVAVLAAQNEAQTLLSVLLELRSLPLAETVVVVNGSSDATANVARAAGCRVIEYPEAIGHDVGRAIGAAAVQADAYLFIDGDIVFRAADLAPFIQSIAAGTDVALNDLSSYVQAGDAVSQAKIFLNRVLGRPDLGSASLTAVPHALSARAVRAIGTARLGIPPVAQAAAVLEGLQVRVVHKVDVVTTNRLHPRTTQDRAPLTVQDLIIGDHLEALGYVMARRGMRCGLTDGKRNRSLLPPLLTE
ncbi:MAG: glycosyltransferase [Thermaerobacter sp.]|nr:glycosyltransferase [Thermaerobacter sp.]